MKRLVIIGAGGFGREVLEWATGCSAYRSEWEIGGFLDDNSQALDAFPGLGLPLLGNTRNYEPRAEDLFICAMGNPALRAAMRQRMENRGGRFTRVVHESCIVGRRVELGEGVVLCPRVILTCDIEIGPNSALNVQTAVGHDARIGADCQLSSFCDVTGYVRLGDRVMLGSRSSIIPGKTIGDEAVIGAGSVVVADVPSRVTVFGNPAKILTHHA